MHQNEDEESLAIHSDEERNQRRDSSDLGVRKSLNDVWLFDTFLNTWKEIKP